MTDPLYSRCETCTRLKVSDDPQVWEAQCSAEIPTNVDYFRTVRMAIPLGRFVSEIDYLKPCPLYDGPVNQSELKRRCAITANYQKSLTHPGNWTNRFETALASHPPADMATGHCGGCGKLHTVADLIGSEGECIDCWLERTRIDDIAIEQAEIMGTSPHPAADEDDDMCDWCRRLTKVSQLVNGCCINCHEDKME